MVVVAGVVTAFVRVAVIIVVRALCGRYICGGGGFKVLVVG